MNTVTAARVAMLESSHWYTKTGEPRHVIKARNGKNRAVTLRDARELNLLPSVTNIQNILAKPGLEAWRIEQACLTVLTAPQGANEQLDAFVKRVLSDERQQDQEAKAAADLGIQTHAALAEALPSGYCAKPEPIGTMVARALNWARIEMEIELLHIEEIVVGDGYAGCCDLRGELHNGPLIVVDWKTTKTIPDKESWPEHREQVAAYAAAWMSQNGQSSGHGMLGDHDAIRGFIAYISTSEPGLFKAYEITDMADAYENGFLPALRIWQRRKGYKPDQRGVNQKLDDAGL